MKKLCLIVLMAGLLFSDTLFAQAGLDNFHDNILLLQGKVEDEARLISTGVPLLLIAPDSRSGAMGDIGVASTPDAYSNHWNAAKLPFAEKQFSVALTYSPWLREIASDINLTYLAGYYKLNELSAIGASLTYFSLGSIDFFNTEGLSTGTYNPNEFSFDVSYSLKLSDNFAASVTGRYIRSDLTQGQVVNNNSTHAASAVSADIGLYYQKDVLSDKPVQYALGLQISNLGNKISYSDNLESSFLPANLRLGGRYTYTMDQFNKVSFMMDLNKLLVPTPPVRDTANEVYKGYEDNVGVLTGVFQ
ncbi:MAG: type IX secretion system outer membrane channel protein PorV [Bacteroidales bacterium]|nr:type IX secretion system outer membrane channel protein PorV [Bacteroidales bacterium]